MFHTVKIVYYSPDVSSTSSTTVPKVSNTDH